MKTVDLDLLTHFADELTHMAHNLKKTRDIPSYTFTDIELNYEIKSNLDLRKYLIHQLSDLLEASLEIGEE